VGNCDQRRMETARPLLSNLGVDPVTVPVITRDKVKYAKPDPDLFLTAADALGHPIESACVVGDSIWDMLARQAGALGVGRLSGRVRRGRTRAGERLPGVPGPC
jgi:phosphoglycolate phosphatase-like HAD superfamily hydrolase